MESANLPSDGASLAQHSSPANEAPCCPRIRLSSETTVSDLLAAFSSSSQPKKDSKPWVSPANFPIAMTEHKRSLRNRKRISYQISDDSDSVPSPTVSSSSFSSPQEKGHAGTRIPKDDEDDFEPEIPKSPPPRLSSAGHSLRQHRDLHLSLRAQENADKPVRKRRKISRKQPKKISVVDNEDGKATFKKSARNEVRDMIAMETTRKRANFLVAKKDYFLPLLPESNYIIRLVEERNKSSQAENLSIPYEAIKEQPEGVKAKMKPYQLSGLSFLIFLNRNGLSGILGDEMGLGKTLQTLSLIQYLKENRNQSEPKAEPRPCLVVCPLSVLNSWISEARRWTPGLKVLRFHGPMYERNRLKKVVIGDEDIYGNETKYARQKKNERRTATGKPLINLDSDSDSTAERREVDIVVTTYEGFQAEQAWFKRAFVWSYVILDEGHKIKNDLSQISKSLQGLGAEYRLILTGTPLQNNLLELWALLRWLYPDVFTERTAESFRNSFNLSRGEVNTKFMDHARHLLELIMLRRMKNSPGVDLNLPPKSEVLLYVPLSPMQRFWYTRLLTRTDQGLLDELFHGAQQKETATLRSEDEDKASWQHKDISELEVLDSYAQGAINAEWEESKEIMRQAVQQEQQDEGKKSAWKKLMNLLMQLRKCCNHPYLLPHAEPNPYYLGEHIIRASTKFIVLDKIISELVVRQKKKVLIFSGFTKMLDCCEDLLSLRSDDGKDFQFVRLDGATSRARRNLNIRMFNKENSDFRIMLISTRAGGLGINLATASDVIMLDQDWNPQIMLQAEARAHRIGQTNPVTVYKLCTQGTVEEQMMGRIQKKLYLSAKVTESMRDIHTQAQSTLGSKGPDGRIRVAADDNMPQLDTSQLMSLVRRGAQALTHPELDENEMLGWDWSTMLEKCKDKPADIHISEQTQANAPLREEDEKKWLAKMEQVESRVFQGKKYTKEKEINNYADIHEEWSREQRRVGKNTTVMIDGFAVSKESLGCADWEAVPTWAGKDPRLADIKRDKKPMIINQEHCQVCWDGGELVLCSGCPRSYHYSCFDEDFKARSKGTLNFSCPQHQCADCQQKTSDAGGMIFRCRWCERGYCEDCLDWEKTDLVGENLPEFELLGFPSVTQAYFICCPCCKDQHRTDPASREFCERYTVQYDTEYRKYLDQQLTGTVAAEVGKKSRVPPSRAGSLTDATSLEDSGVSTPQFGSVDRIDPQSLKKREAASQSFLSASTWSSTFVA